MNYEEYVMCVGIVLNNLLTLQIGSELETMLFAQYLTLRLAYQNGIDSEILLEIIKIDDENMVMKSDIPHSEIQSFRSKRIDRFSDYEGDWNGFKSGSWVKTSPFDSARMIIYGEDSLSFDVYLPFSTAVVGAVKQLQDLIGKLDDIDDEWENDFMLLLEEYQDQL